MRYLKSRIDKPLTFVSCGQFVSNAGWIHTRRVIDSFEIIIGIRGITYIEQDGDRYEIIPGSVLLLSPGRLHQGYRPSEENTSFYWFHFYIRGPFSFIEQKEAFSEISPVKSNPYTSLFSESMIVPTFLQLENKEKPGILLKQLLHITKSKYYTSLAADYMITLILMEISQQAIDNALNAYNNEVFQNTKFINMLEWIRINIQSDISIDELAGRFNFNKDYISRLFKRHLGVSVTKYINGMKVSKAKEFLCLTEKSIKEIAYDLGFSDEKYFMKLFKEYENITPSEFRNTYYQTYLNNV